VPVSPHEEVTVPKILVIDDDAQIRDMISLILELEGHCVVTAENGVTGVARHCAELPDLVITDMIMPEQGGAETIIKIRQATPDARIIAVSGGGSLDGAHPLVVAKRLGAMETLQTVQGSRISRLRHLHVGSFARAQRSTFTGLATGEPTTRHAKRYGLSGGLLRSGSGRPSTAQRASSRASSSIA